MRPAPGSRRASRPAPSGHRGARPAPPAAEQRDFTVPSATPSICSRLRDRHTVHVDEHQDHPLVLGKAGQGLAHVEARLGRGVRGRGRSMMSMSAASPARRRTSRSRRSRSRQALTTMRCSQVVTAASPRKDPARRKAVMKPSWTQSAASSRSPVVRTATAHIRSRCRRNSSPKASVSPATWRAMRARSESRRPRASRSCQSVTSTSPRHGAVAAVVVGGELGEPDDDVLTLGAGLAPGSSRCRWPRPSRRPWWRP